MEQVEERSLAMANCGKEERKYHRGREIHREIDTARERERERERDRDRLLALVSLALATALTCSIPIFLYI